MKWESMELRLTLNYVQKDIYVSQVQLLRHLQMELKEKDEILVITALKELLHKFNVLLDHMNQEMELIQQVDKHVQQDTSAHLVQLLQLSVRF